QPQTFLDRPCTTALHSKKNHHNKQQSSSISPPTTLLQPVFAPTFLLSRQAVAGNQNSLYGNGIGSPRVSSQGLFLPNGTSPDRRPPAKSPLTPPLSDTSTAQTLLIDCRCTSNGRQNEWRYYSAINSVLLSGGRRVSRQRFACGQGKGHTAVKEKAHTRILCRVSPPRPKKRLQTTPRYLMDHSSRRCVSSSKYY
ncbi:unnamed protein product, partial [Ectocarpus sp. 8 AP-2014]